MFDIFPNFLSSILSLLLPLYASHRALTTRDPSALAPWLTYFVVLSSLLLVESYFSFLLSLIPFYTYLRLLLHLYLLLPQTRGAQIVYTTYISPFLNAHEASIERFISDAHDGIKAAGLQYFKQAIEYVRENVLGLQHVEARGKSAAEGSYAQSLLGRFNLPSGAPAGADVYAMLSSTVNQALTAGGGWAFPPSSASPEEKISFISGKREQLLALLGMLDREEKEALSSVASSATSKAAMPVEEVAHVHQSSSDDDDAGLRKVRSEMDFERVERDEAGSSSTLPPKEKGGWLPWGFGRTASSSAASQTGARKEEEKGHEEEAKGVSSAVQPNSNPTSKTIPIS